MIKIYSALITDFTQADYTEMYSLLDCALREKIDAKKQEDDKLCSLAGYILLYRGVYELYGKTNFRITFNSRGKPVCDFCFFNISHSENRIVCAIGNEAMGIDIQKIKPIKLRPQYKFFNKRENFYVNHDNALASTRYAEIFTKKESAVKLLGLSLSHSKFIDTFSNDFCFKTQFDNDFITTVCSKNKEFV